MRARLPLTVELNILFTGDSSTGNSCRDEGVRSLILRVRMVCGDCWADSDVPTRPPTAQASSGLTSSTSPVETIQEVRKSLVRALRGDVQGGHVQSAFSLLSPSFVSMYIFAIFICLARFVAILIPPTTFCWLCFILMLCNFPTGLIGTACTETRNVGSTGFDCAVVLTRFVLIVSVELVPIVSIL